MDDQNQQFYFQGKFFDDEKEFWKYVKDWNHLHLDEKTAESLMDNLKKEIILNIFMRDINLKNGEFRQFLSMIFDFTMKELNLLHRSCERCKNELVACVCMEFDNER